MDSGRRWTVQDRHGNVVYLTEERWRHITERHPEMIECEAELRSTIQSGQRRQEPLHPQKFRYSKAFADLPDDNTHVFAFVLFGYEERDGGIRPNNYVLTAYQQELR
jgi:hypothetical protein